MRTTFQKKLQSILRWLRLWIISGKKILSAREAAIYLKTDVVTIYRLQCHYFLPSYKTSRQTLYFKRAEIDEWFKPRCRGNLPHNLRKRQKEENFEE